jgi:hypothetical protein
MESIEVPSASIHEGISMFIKTYYSTKQMFMLMLMLMLPFSPATQHGCTKERKMASRHGRATERLKRGGTETAVHELNPDV